MALFYPHYMAMLLESAMDGSRAGAGRGLPAARRLGLFGGFGTAVVIRSFQTLEISWLVVWNMFFSPFSWG